MTTRRGWRDSFVTGITIIILRIVTIIVTSIVIITILIYAATAATRTTHRRERSLHVGGRRDDNGSTIRTRHGLLYCTRGFTPSV